MFRTLFAMTTLLSALFVQAQPLEVQLSVVHDACGNGTGQVTVVVQGGVQPLTVEWSNGVISSGDTLILTITGLVADTYSVTVTDDVGMVATGLIDVMDMPELQFPWQSGTAYTCDGQCRNLTYTNPGYTQSGVPPYTVTVDPPITSAEFLPGYNYVALVGLCPGLHTITLEDALGCTKVWTLDIADAPSPQLLDQTISPTCLNGSDGELTLLFDMPILVSAYPMQGGAQPDISYGPPEQAILTGLSEGLYEVYVHNTAYPDCFDTLYVDMPSTTVDCGSISGTIYAELDGDCVLNGSDVPLPNRMVDIQPGTQPVLSDASGYYSTGIGYGNYAVDHASSGFAVLCPDPVPVNVTVDMVTPDVVVDFAMEPLTGPDAGIFLWVSALKPGVEAQYMVHVINSGPYALTDLTIDLHYDAQLTVLSADPVPVVNDPGAAQWSIPGLAPFATVVCSLLVQVPNDPGLIGTTMDATATLNINPPDADPTNNLASLATLVTNAFDPNDKQALTSSGNAPGLYIPALDTHIDYTIRFQNTGNAPAEQVYILDTIAPSLDLLTFQPLVASHPFSASLLDGRTLRFDFPQILLPDSLSDPVGSQGFIRFRMHPTDPQPGDTLANTADIFFELNPPVRTNTAVLTVETTNTILQQEESGSILFPNPADDHVRLVLDSGNDHTVRRLLLVDELGRTVLDRQLGASGVLVLPTGQLAPGVYHLRALQDDGRVKTAKLVVAH